MFFLRESKRLVASTLSRALTNVEKHAFDNQFMKEKVLKGIPTHITKARSHLGTWDELWILFQSPFLSVQTKLELEMEKYYSSTDTSLPVPLSGLLFRKRIWDELSLEVRDLDFVEELSLLSKGALGLYLRSTFELSRIKLNLPLIQRTRLSGSKIKILWERSLLVKSIKSVIRKEQIMKFSPTKVVPGKGFVILSYTGPLTRSGKR